jgi:DNA/RNA-binding domain of Phe-tRNA-synthetase-like protein
MRKSRLTEEQMVAILREADRTTVAEAAKKHKVSEPTIYAWRKHFGQLEVADVKLRCPRKFVAARSRVRSTRDGDRTNEEAIHRGTDHWLPA